MTTSPFLVRSMSASGAVRYALGDPLVDRYLEFVAGRARPNTLRAVAFDLKTFFTVIEKEPVTVEPSDVFEFLAAQRGDRSVVRLTDRESGRDRAMVLAMLLAGLRRGKVLGLRFVDVMIADKRLVITEGKGGHHLSCRLRTGSSMPSAGIFTTSDPRLRRQTGCSWC